MRDDNRPHALYTLDEFFVYLIDTILQFEKQMARSQTTGMVPPQLTRTDWFRRFIVWSESGSRSKKRST